MTKSVDECCASQDARDRLSRWLENDDVSAIPSVLETRTPMRRKWLARIACTAVSLLVLTVGIIDADNNTVFFILLLVVQNSVEDASANNEMVSKLFSRVRHNRLPEVTDLLDAGIDVDARDDNGNTPLMIAFQVGLRWCLRALPASACLTHSSPRGRTGIRRWPST